MTRLLTRSFLTKSVLEVVLSIYKTSGCRSSGNPEIPPTPKQKCRAARFSSPAILKHGNRHFENPAVRLQDPRLCAPTSPCPPDLWAGPPRMVAEVCPCLTFSVVSIPDVTAYWQEHDTQIVSVGFPVPGISGATILFPVNNVLCHRNSPIRPQARSFIHTI